MSLRTLKIVFFIFMIGLLGAVTFGIWQSQSPKPSKPLNSELPSPAPKLPEQPLSTPKPNAVAAPITVTPPVNEIQPAEPNNPQLDTPIIIPQTLTLKPRAERLDHGPMLPNDATQSVPVEKKLLQLPKTPSEDKQQLNFGYDGKDEEKYKLNLGITDDGVAVQTRLKTDQAAKQVELEGIEIEIKLPK